MRWRGVAAADPGEGAGVDGRGSRRGSRTPAVDPGVDGRGSGGGAVGEAVSATCPSFPFSTRQIQATAALAEAPAVARLGRPDPPRAPPSPSPLGRSRRRRPCRRSRRRIRRWRSWGGRIRRKLLLPLLHRAADLGRGGPGGGPDGGSGGGVSWEA